MTTLREHIDRLDLQTWAALTQRTAQAAVDAAEHSGRPAPPQLAAVAAMTESELIDNYRTSARQRTRRLPTLRQRIAEANVQLQQARKATAKALREKDDALTEAKIAREQAESATTAAEEAREVSRTAREELARKELERTVQHRADLQRIEDMQAELAKAKADTTAAYATAGESGKAAQAAKEREVAALDKYAKQGAQLAADQRRVQTALDEALSTIESLRSELERTKTESATQIAAANEKTSAAEQRAEERRAERIADRKEAEREMGRLRAEIDRNHSAAQAEIAAANQKVHDANNEAHQRMAERTQDRTDSQHAIGVLQGHLTQARQHASNEVSEAREQAALAIAVAGQNMDATIEKARADARREVSDAHEQVQQAQQLLAETRQQLEAAHESQRSAEKATHDLRDAIEAHENAARLGLAVPVPPADIRVAAGRIEYALSVLHQVDYLVAVRLAVRDANERPIELEEVRELTRTAQIQLTALIQELDELPTRLPDDQDQRAAATQYSHIAGSACRAILLRIAGSAEHIRDRGRSDENLDTIIGLLYRPEVQWFVPEWRTGRSAEALT